MSIDVGKRLVTIRTRKGLSQRELANRAGVTNGTISLIEQNKVSPSIGSLKKVLDGIPMTLGEFFTAGEEVGEDRVVFRKDQQPDLGQGGISFFLVGAGRENRAMAIMREVMQPGSDTGADRLQHDGQEGGVVISGRLELSVGDKVRELGPGDGYYFNSREPHRFRNIGDEELIIVSANSPPSF